MEYQGDFLISIDVPENIISLCPNCHRAFHNSVVSNQENLIFKFFKRRSFLLKQRGIEITKQEILEYYKNKTQ